ncbi:MAG: PRC-barrel domain containing protein, partial [Phycisphaeraceae bacterium]
QQDQWDRNQSGYSSSDSLFAVVTCIVDRTKVREVVVDMRDNSIVGVQSLHAFESDRSGFAGSNDRGYDRDSSFQQGQYADQGRPNLVRASDLMNATVRNPSGDKLGNIDELAIDPDNNRVVYGVLRRGGFLGIGESRYAIASSELSVPRDGRMQLNLNNSDFQGRSGFDNKSWPTRSDPEWNTNWTSQTETAPAARRVVKASDIIGTNVRCSDGRDFASISDLIVEPQSGRILYAILDSDRGDMPVPMSALRKQGDDYALPMSSQQLQSQPAFDSRNDPNWTDARWNRRIHESYGVQMDSSGSTTPRRDTR